MDSNKDEALRCVRIAEEAIGSGNKERALKFIKIARRLDSNLSVDGLLSACETIGTDSKSQPPSPIVENGGSGEKRGPGGNNKVDEGLNRERSYTEEHVQLIRDIRRNKDYYEILGVERTSSVEEIRKAYRKLSLKVHPDKNKAPGSEEAFKKVCKAFKCLSDVGSRRQYDQVGLVDDFEYNQQHIVRQRRRRTAHSYYYEEEFDPDEIFRSFFRQPDAFGTTRVYRTRGAAGTHQREEFQGGGLNFMILIQILPFLLIFLLAYLPFSEPEYSLQKNFYYQIPKTTEKHGVEFYVKSSSFDENYPVGSSKRAGIEDHVTKDYRYMLWRFCHVEQQKRQWNKNLPTPHCTKLENLGLA